MENWILAKNIKGEVIKIRQRKVLGDIFVDEKGNEYQAHDLDLTEARFDLPDDFKKEFEENNKRFSEQQLEQQELMNKMLSSMDANAIADHKAAIEEREYWRKLREEIFMKMMEKFNTGLTKDADSALTLTKYIFNQLYDQDYEFFKGKMMFSLPIK